MKPKEPIQLRQKPLKGGGFSLYLDTWHEGKREYEFLRLYLTEGKNKAQRDENARVLQLANAIKAKRIIALQNGVHGFQARAEGVRFLDFFDTEAGKRTGSTFATWRGARRLLCLYETREGLPLSKITPAWVRGFYDFLSRYHSPSGRHLTNGAQRVYVMILRAALRAAIKKGYLSTSVLEDMPALTRPTPDIKYLSLDEVRAIAAAPMEDVKEEGVRKAFLFSCLTGLRYSDVAKLTWSEVHEDTGRVRLIFNQQKTRTRTYLDIAEQAVGLMGERGMDSAIIFPQLSIPATQTFARKLSRVMKAAGITRHITFHMARHTFATLALNNGVDLYTVSKLLGHSDVSVTQVYAKVLDKRKQEAVDKLPSIF